MEIIKPHHKPSERITKANRKRALAEAIELVRFLDENNRKGFDGNWERAVALSHCQVSNEPMAMFAVSGELFARKVKAPTRNQNRKNWFFPSRVVYNAEIVEALDEIERMVPKREVVRVPNSKEFRVEIKKAYKMVSNLIEMPDACMSYPNKTKKHTKRYHTIRVKYQIWRSFFGFHWLKTIEEEVEGLKAHIFQHEIDHSFGIDMYFGNGETSNPEKPYKNAGFVPPKVDDGIPQATREA